jgi:hypothetical protein
MTLRLNDSYRNRILNSGYKAIEGNSKLRIYSGSQPASANNAATGTLLVEISLPATAFSAATPGNKKLVLSGTWQATAGTGGTAGWFRLLHTGNDDRMDGSVTASGGGGDLQLDTVTITAGGTVTINTFDVIGQNGTGAFKLSDGAVSELLNAGLEAVWNSGNLGVYDGSVPANANASSAANLLVTIPLGANAFDVAPSPTTGKIDLPSAISNAAAAAGTAAWFRIWESGFGGADDVTGLDEARVQGTVALSGGTINLDALVFAITGVVQVSAFEISTPAN